MRLISTVLLCGLCGSASAITWVPTQVEDPISGKRCKVSEPASFGSYIYSFPSKYDGVYWPHTDPQWMWFCPDSGYISFGDDFSELEPDEIERVRTYLGDHCRGNRADMSTLEKLVMLESVYRLRDKNEFFWAWFKRVKAVYLDELARSEREQTIPMLEKELAQLEPGFEMIQKLYVLGDYYRQTGEHERALELFERAKTLEWKDEDGNRQVGSEYINEIIGERTKLIPR